MDAPSETKRRSVPRAKRRPRSARRADPLERDFGPGAAPAEEPPLGDRATGRAGTDPDEPGPRGPMPGIACAGEGCLLKPAADLVGRFVARRGGSATLSLAAISGLELLRALRDFLDEEIALAERASGRTSRPPRYERIPVE